jgi:hypothetical protein
MHPKQNLLRLPIRTCVCFLITSALLAAHPSSAATLEVVTAGQPVQLVNGDNPSARLPTKDGAVLLTGFRDLFPVTAKLGESFTAKVRMAVGKAKNAGASLVLNGQSHFGFYGGQRRMFLSGPFFKGVVLDRPTPDPVLAGKPFDLQVVRTASPAGATLEFRIDGETILTMEGPATTVESLGFRPSYSDIRIESMTLEGDATPAPPPPMPASDKTGVAKALELSFHRASEEDQKLWDSHRKALQRIDLSGDANRRVIIAQGSATDYHAHPTTALLADGKTMFCVWNMGHGGSAGPVARSDDGGLTWTRIDELMPPNYRNFKNCPSLYRITGPDGKERLWIFAARTLVKNEKPTEVPGRLEGSMPRVVSEDGGKTWREEPPLSPISGPDAKFSNVMTFSSMVPLKDGSILGLYHERRLTDTVMAETVMQTISKNGGFTWSDPRVVAGEGKSEGKDPCEPYVFRSPDGNELACIMRENMRTGVSLMMFSQDEGATWSEPVPTPWGLTGDRHQGIQLPDGRLVIVFRNGAPGSEDRFVAWVGTYDDIKQGKPGQYTIALLNNFSDGGYPGIHLLPDETIVATTYASLNPQEKPSIVSVRFKMSELDEMAAKLTPATKN